MKDELIAIIEYYGIENQIQKTFEEMDELATAIDEKDERHIAEEIADVLIMIEQIKLIYGILDTDIDAIQAYKIKRTFERMQGGIDE